LEKLFTDKRFQPIIISANPKWSWPVDTGRQVHFLDGVVVFDREEQEAQCVRMENGTRLSRNLPGWRKSF